MRSDPFRPAHEPYRSIYDGYCVAADRLRNEQDVQSVDARLIDAVREVAAEQAQRHQLRAPTRFEVEEARQSAAGHSDFGLTWVCNVVRAMQRPRPSLPAPSEASARYREGWVRGNLHAIAGGALDADGPQRAEEEVWVGFVDCLAAHRAAERHHD